MSELSNPNVGSKKSRKKKSKTSNSVQVAVRVRPLNSKEKKKKYKCCVEMHGNTTIVYDPSGEKQDGRYTYDFSYNSMDPKSENFASQQTIYEDLGKQVIDNAVEGYNSCVFAYGQTGSGKSYTVFGSNQNPGLIPRLCTTLFEKINEISNAKDSKILRCRVEVSMMEIYNEKVRDLFNPLNPKNATGLKVRENNKTGPYVEGLTNNIARNYGELQTMMEEGSKLRTIESTSMNDVSSRSHTIFQIIFTQIFNWSQKGKKRANTKKGKNKKGQRVSKINIIDLAGSERQGKAKTEGKRLKEGTAINLSLTMLGNVINKLADLSGGKKSVFVPYRDSTLTWLLKESLGGNSKTVMIATISPSSSNYLQTLGTLKYANRAKEIKNHAVVNEDPQSKLIGDLRNEIERLKELLSSKGFLNPPSISNSNNSNNNMAQQQEQLMKFQAIKLQLEQSQKIINQLQMSDEEREKESLKLSEERKRALKEAGVSGGFNRKEVPHIVNLNEDPQLNESLLYFFKPNSTTSIGSSKNKQNNIVLLGEQVEKVHCLVVNEKNLKVFLTPCKGEKEQISPVKVNGRNIVEKTELHSHDRIIIGKNHYFRFQNPNEKLEKKSNAVIDWDFVKLEMEKSMKDMFRKKRIMLDKKLKEEFEKRRKAEELRIKELERMRKELDVDIKDVIEANKKRKEEDKRRLEEIHSLEKEVQSFNNKLIFEKEQKDLLEEQSKKNKEKVDSLKSTVEYLRTELQKQKKETNELDRKHKTEKNELEMMTKKLQKTMITLSNKLKSVENEKKIKEEEHERQKKKLNSLKSSVFQLEDKLKNEIEKKRKLQEESQRLQKSERGWKKKHEKTKTLLIAKTQETNQLMPVLQNMFFAQENNHRNQIKILQEQLSVQKTELSNIQDKYRKNLDKIEKEKNNNKSEFVIKLLNQIDKLMLDKKNLTQQLKMVENINVKELKSRIYKLENEKIALQQLNIQLDTKSKDRLEIIKVLERNLQQLQRNKK